MDMLGMSNDCQILARTAVEGATPGSHGAMKTGVIGGNETHLNLNDNTLDQLSKILFRRFIRDDMGAGLIHMTRNTRDGTDVRRHAGEQGRRWSGLDGQAGGLIQDGRGRRGEKAKVSRSKGSTAGQAGWLGRKQTGKGKPDPEEEGGREGRGDEGETKLRRGLMQGIMQRGLTCTGAAGAGQGTTEASDAAMDEDRWTSRWTSVDERVSMDGRVSMASKGRWWTELGKCGQSRPDRRENPEQRGLDEDGPKDGSASGEEAAADKARTIDRGPACLADTRAPPVGRAAVGGEGGGVVLVWCWCGVGVVTS
ncbi:uncharacterized protein BJ171DRAFT_471305 [Polychytrium aggregatum]|uniref:uncharacterized protein n=1 Tax=Polychytrium aggregatum TaxID=110093 RepID=UPI0022FF25E2|nr:uncharacterized protein BJ171DRAFT_471305 [Polychytrium aggregatum]KAI9208979.1 hypothetical protein BJ171DRAFT_471305 [Polychytrium aggregatum]